MSTNPLDWAGGNLCRKCHPLVVGGWMTELILVRRSIKHKWHIYQPWLKATRCGRLWSIRKADGS